MGKCGVKEKGVREVWKKWCGDVGKLPVVCCEDYGGEWKGGAVVREV